MSENKSFLKRYTTKLFGGIKMSWLNVIIFAIATAFVTAVFLVLPIFANTSFGEMGACYESWIFFAIIIMTNCKKPIESATKTFVFFLVSQPLIYLFQVPFYHDGFKIFQYYPHWFTLTLFTFPMAFAGWYLKKRNWISLLILTPMLLLLAELGCHFLIRCEIISFLFCFLQIFIYLYAFFDDWKKKLIGAVSPIVISIVGLVYSTYFTDVVISKPLPDQPHFSKEAVIEFEDSSYGEPSIVNAEGGYVSVHMKKYGKTVLIITDGDKKYTYDVEAKRNRKTVDVNILPRQ